MTEDAITQIFAYLNNETSNPQVSLLPLKQRLSSSAGLDAAINLIHAQPDCTAQQLVQLIASFGQVICNPPQDVLTLAKPILQSQLNATAAEIPDQISLMGTDSQSLSLGNLRLARIHHATQSAHPAGILIWDYDFRGANIQRLAGMVGLAVFRRRRNRHGIRIQRRAIVPYRP